MKPPRTRELWALPELALVPVTLAAIDGLLASLQAQHGTLRDEWQPGDPATLRDARTLAHQLVQARHALVRYARTVRRTLRQPDIERPLPF